MDLQCHLRSLVPEGGGKSVSPRRIPDLGRGYEEEATRIRFLVVLAQAGTLKRREIAVPKKDDFEDIIIKGHAKLRILSRWEDRDYWIREVSPLAAADWTDDGNADLLVLYYDRALNMGTYYSLSPMIPTTDSRPDVITAVEAAYWIVDHRKQLLKALGHLRK